jgi:RNA polymerase sigma-70 factor, ECF subfamily
MQAYNSCSDREIAQAIKNSDAAAFKALHSRYYESLYRYFWLRVHCPHCCRDLIQELFVRIWKNRQQLEPDKSLRGYIYHIANNLIIDYIRKKSREKGMLRNYANEMAHPVENVYDQNDIARAIGALPENLRLTFILSRHQGLKYAEIAQACNVSVKTVESRMGRALRILRHELFGQVK